MSYRKTARQTNIFSKFELSLESLQKKLRIDEYSSQKNSSPTVNLMFACSWCSKQLILQSVLVTAVNRATNRTEKKNVFLSMSEARKKTWEALCSFLACSPHNWMRFRPAHLNSKSVIENKETGEMNLTHSEYSTSFHISFFLPV